MGLERLLGTSGGRVASAGVFPCLLLQNQLRLCLSVVCFPLAVSKPSASERQVMRLRTRTRGCGRVSIV